jgi:hypothetical protein
MDVEADFEMPGVEASAPARDGHSLTLRLGSRDEVEQGLPPAERIGELRLGDGRLAASLDDAGEWGYLAQAFDFGYARIAPDGRDTLIAPLGGQPEWVWQRYLTGQVVPLAALLQGYEVFHACALGLDRRAIAVAAASGIGKTTTALRLVLRGLDFLSDDVLVLEPTEHGVRAHPGVGVANVRPGASDVLAELREAGLASVVGSSERETRISVPRSDEALPLAAFFILARYADARPLEVERLAPVDPRVLLGSTFNFAINARERLERQLDVCSRLERSASVFVVSCGTEVPGEAVARAILERARVP